MPTAAPRKRKRPRLSPSRIHVDVADIIKCLSVNNSDAVSAIEDIRALTRDTSEKELSAVLCDTVAVQHFSVSFYWMLHIRGVLKFSCFVSEVDERRVVESICQLWNSSDDDIQRDIFRSIIIYLFNDASTVSVENTSYGKKCWRIIDEVCMAYNTSLSPRLCIRDMKRIYTVCHALLQSENTDGIRRFQIHIIGRLLPALLTLSANSSGASDGGNDVECTSAETSSIVAVIKELWTLLHPTSVLTALELSLQAEHYCPFDYEAYHQLLSESGGCCAPLLHLMLPYPLYASAVSADNSTCLQPLLNTEQVLEMATTVGTLGVANQNMAYFLRSCCMVEISCGSSDISQWLDRILGPAPSNLPTDSELQFASPKEFNHICLSLCEAVAYQSEACLRTVYSRIRDRRSICADTAGVYLQLAKGRLRVLDKLRSVVTSGGKGYGSPVEEITSARVKAWADTIRRTGYIPVVVTNMCGVFGRTSAKNILSSLCSLVTTDRSLSSACETLVQAMSKATPPLCTSADAQDFLGFIHGTNSTIESKIKDAIGYIYDSSGSAVDSMDESDATRERVRDALRCVLSVGEYISSISGVVGDSAFLSSEEVDDIALRWKTASVVAFRVVQSTFRGRLAASLTLAALQAMENIYNNLELTIPTIKPPLPSSNSESISGDFEWSGVKWLLDLSVAISSVFASPEDIMCHSLKLFLDKILLPIAWAKESKGNLPVRHSSQGMELDTKALVTSAYVVGFCSPQVQVVLAETLVLQALTNSGTVSSGAQALIYMIIHILRTLPTSIFPGKRCLWVWEVAFLTLGGILGPTRSNFTTHSDRMHYELQLQCYALRATVSSINDIVDFFRHDMSRLLIRWEYALEWRLRSTSVGIASTSERDRNIMFEIIWKYALVNFARSIEGTDRTAVSGPSHTDTGAVAIWIEMVQLLQREHENVDEQSEPTSGHLNSPVNVVSRLASAVLNSLPVDVAASAADAWFENAYLSASLIPSKSTPRELLSFQYQMLYEAVVCATINLSRRNAQGCYSSSGVAKYSSWVLCMAYYCKQLGKNSPEHMPIEGVAACSSTFSTIQEICQQNTANISRCHMLASLEWFYMFEMCSDFEQVYKTTHVNDPTSKLLHFFVSTLAGASNVQLDIGNVLSNSCLTDADIYDSICICSWTIPTVVKFAYRVSNSLITSRKLADVLKRFIASVESAGWMKGHATTRVCACACASSVLLLERSTTIVQQRSQTDMNVLKHLVQAAVLVAGWKSSVAEEDIIEELKRYFPDIFLNNLQRLLHSLLV